jgi:uroporphyrinogen-III synthase
VRILVTRPQADSERTAARLTARGIQVMLAPLLRMESIDADLGPPCGAIAITSANAIEAIATHPRRAELLALPAFVVGRRTAEAARAAGFADVKSADGNQHDLARLIATRYSGDNPLLYLAGEDRTGDLARDLKAEGVRTHLVVVYRAARVDALPPEAAEALAAGRLDGVLHFSRRSAEIFLDCAAAAALRHLALNLAHYCLSRQVAEPLAAAGAGRLLVAARADEAALLALLG